MITKLNPLPKIPYVDGVPSDSFQMPIKWILNGETLEGAATKLSNEGNLNQIGVLIQQNAVQLEDNTITNTNKINEVIDQVNLISENLDTISDENVIDIVNGSVSDIQNLNGRVNTVEGSVMSHTVKLSALSDEIGAYDSATDPKHRTIRKDIIFLKNELGAYAGFDVNGTVDPSSTGTGLKYKVMQNALATSIQEGRLTKLEDEWAISDVGHLTQELLDLRGEVGPKGLATVEPVYVRLNTINTRIDNTNAEMAVINTYIGRTGSGGTGSLVNRVTLNETEISSLKVSIFTPSSGLVSRMGAIETTIGTSTTPGGVKYDIAQAKRGIMDINLVIGESGDEGLRGEVASALSDIGSDSEPLTMKGRILNLEDTARDTASRLIDAESRIGNSSSGLVAANMVIGKDLYGDATSTDPFIKDGIKKSLQTVITEIGNDSTTKTGIYKLISDLAARVTQLEAEQIQMKLDILAKANISDLVNYYTKTESDAKFQPVA